MKIPSRACHWVIICLCLVMSEGRAWADIIDIDINGQNGPSQANVLAGENWHGLNVPLASGNTSATGTFGGIGVTLSSTSGSFDSRDRANGSFSYVSLYRDFAVATLESTTLDLTVSGLKPKSLYDIRLQSFDSDVNGSGNATWKDTTNGGLGNSTTFTWNPMPDPSGSLLNDSGVLLVRTDNSGKFAVSGIGTNGGVRLNGFELNYATSVPEPSAWVLTLVGLLFLIGWQFLQGVRASHLSGTQG